MRKVVRLFLFTASFALGLVAAKAYIETTTGSSVDTSIRVSQPLVAAQGEEAIDNP